jgi:two-component system response regulator YesN
VILFGSSEERHTEIRTAGRKLEIAMSDVERLASLVRRRLQEESRALVDDLLSTLWNEQPTIVEARSVLSRLLIVVSLESRSFLSTAAGDREPHSSVLHRFDWLTSSRGFRSVVQEQISGMIRSRAEHTGDLVSRALDKMHAADTHQVTLAGIADELGVSSGYLGTLIRGQTGQKFTEVLNGIRMKKAMTLLDNPRLRVSDVADAVGLRDPSHFHEVFRRHVGMTPTEFRHRAAPAENDNQNRNQDQDEQQKEERDAGKQG